MITATREAGNSGVEIVRYVRRGFRPLRGLIPWYRFVTWGSASLHPRLYAVARFAR